MNWQLARGMPALWALAAAMVAADVGRAEVNLVPNPDFEIDADASGNPDLWFRGGTTGYPNDDSGGGGTKSVSSQNGADWRSQAFPVSPGQVLRYLLDYKVSQGATGTIRTDLRFFTGMSGGGTSAHSKANSRRQPTWQLFHREFGILSGRLTSSYRPASHRHW